MMSNRRSTLLTLAALTAAPAFPFLAQAQTADSPSQGLPLRHVALFSSGVGYFSRAGIVDGEGDV